MTKIGVQILKTHNRFQLTCPYNKKFEVKESKPVVFIKSIGDKFEVKFSKFIEEFKKYLEFGGRRYNASERKITMPKEHLEAVISLSNEFGFEIVITDEILVD